MQLVFVFAVLLLLAVLVSEWARRSVLSTSVLFLAGGFLAGPGGLGLVDVGPDDPGLQRFIELTLFAVLFSDGMRLRPRELRQTWRLHGRSLLLGMPLVFAGTSVLARVLVDLDWSHALLAGAVLAPTDPVFASAIVGREDVPYRLRHLLNVESGLNDGIALPVVVLLIAAAGGGDSAEPTTLLAEVSAGIGLGIALPWTVLAARRRLRLPPSSPVYEPLLAFALGLLVWAFASLTHANPFLAAFAAGATVAATDETAREDFRRFGDVVGELLKLAALLLLGSLVALHQWRDLGAGAWIFAALALLVVRPAALLGALVRSPLERRERLAAAWFGPKGFASVAYALLVLRSGIDGAVHLYHVLALVIALSIVAHSSTDVVVARWFRQRDEDERQPGGAAARGGPDARRTDGPR